MVGVVHVERDADGQIDVVFRTNEGLNSTRTQLLTIAAFGIGVLDWRARLGEQTAPFLTPDFTVEAQNTATEGDASWTRRRPPAAHSSGSCSSCCCSSRS